MDQNKQLVDRIEEIYMHLIEIEQEVRFNLSAIRMLKKDLLDTKKKLTGKESFQRKQREKRAQQKPTAHKAAMKDRLENNTALQKTFNSMSFEERLKFLRENT